MSQSIRDHYLSSPLFGANAPYVEDLYESYQRDPASVPENWRRFFASMGPPPAAVTRVVSLPSPGTRAGRPA
ncbi:MAG: hypothetical protein DYH20_11675, partial [Gammaproteobacteria bacterium PRO9]|nr:hypothetical protein [Gammaproteobacteria bacterium PRO9]